MNITFSDKKLAKLANNDRALFKHLGKIRALKFKTRMTQLEVAVTLEELRTLPGNYHELIGNRKGQWACDLDQPYRMIFTPHEKPIPQNESGCYVWLEIKGVEIIELISYHQE